MENTQIETLLRQHGLKKTPVRVAVMRLLSDRGYALSQPELEDTFENKENRVTVYRVLRDLEEKGLIHKVYDLGGTAKFALCHSNCDEHHHHDEHLHFNCVECGNVYCINDTEIPTIRLPKGFQMRQLSLQAQGVCDTCTEKKS